MENKVLGTEWLVEQLRNGKELNDELINEAKQIEESSFIQPKKVRIKDYERDVNYLMLALKGAGISIDYITTDLVQKCVNMVRLKGGKSSLMDMCELKIKHNAKWDDYFKNLKEEDESEG